MVGAIDPLFQRALGPDWQQMPQRWRDIHAFEGTQDLSGQARISRGQGMLSRLVAAVFRFPQAAEEVPVKVRMERIGDTERWTRQFGAQSFQSVLRWAGPGRLYERFGIFTFELSLPIRDAVMGMPVEKGWCLGVPLPKAMLPRSETREFIEDGVFQFDVRLSAPLAGLIVHYRGWLT